HPALWHVKGPEGEVYLLGSIHLLPKNIDWHTPTINAAIARSNVFVFEVSTDEKAQTEIQDLIAKLGTLPPGQSLRASLPPAVQADFDAAIADAHLPLALVDHEKPWLVSLQLLVAEGVAKHYSAEAGVDHALMGFAARPTDPCAISKPSSSSC